MAVDVEAAVAHSDTSDGDDIVSACWEIDCARLWNADFGSGELKRRCLRDQRQWSEISRCMTSLVRRIMESRKRLKLPLVAHPGFLIHG